MLLGVRVHLCEASQHQSFHQRPLDGAGQQVEGGAAAGKLLRQVPPALTLHHDVGPEQTGRQRGCQSDRELRLVGLRVSVTAEQFVIIITNVLKMMKSIQMHPFKDLLHENMYCFTAHSVSQLIPTNKLRSSKIIQFPKATFLMYVHEKEKKKKKKEKCTAGPNISAVL